MVQVRNIGQRIRWRLYTLAGTLAGRLRDGAGEDEGARKGWTAVSARRIGMEAIDGDLFPSDHFGLAVDFCRGDKPAVATAAPSAVDAAVAEGKVSDGAGENDHFISGVNFEGHKIGHHALRLGARFVLNLQIAMDAPFHGDVADESTRAAGPSEEGFEGYNREVMVAGLRRGAQALRDAMEGKSSRFDEARVGQAVNTLIIQIARGRRAPDFQRDVMEPIIQSVFFADARTSTLNVVYVHGYRSTSYFTTVGDHETAETRAAGAAAVLNVGMFARIGTHRPQPGQVFACMSGRSIEMDPITNRPRHCEHAGENVGDHRGGEVVATDGILLDGGLPHVHLLGLADSMPFVTPDQYKEQDLLSLL